MNEQQKLEILCAYLPYGVEVKDKVTNQTFVLDSENLSATISDLEINTVRPILRHRDDMTEEEKATYAKLFQNNSNFIQCATECLRYLHSRHIDTFGAIESGWAVMRNINEKG